MSDNPFQAPAVEYVERGEASLKKDEARRSTEELREIARWQRWVLWSLLVRILLAIPLVLVERSAAPIFLGLGIAVSLAAVYAIFKLTRAFYGPTMSVLSTLVALVPGIVGLLVLVAVNQQATGVLNRHGVRVGFMGVDPSRIPDR